MAITTKTWITGEEYNRERRRLLDAGYSYPDAPEFQELMRRMQERNDYLFERFGRRLIDEYPGQYVVISVDGRTLVGPRAGELVHRAEAEFGTYDFAVFRLADPPYDKLR